MRSAIGPSLLLLRRRRRRRHLANPTRLVNNPTRLQPSAPHDRPFTWLSADRAVLQGRRRRPVGAAVRTRRPRLLKADEDRSPPPTSAYHRAAEGDWTGGRERERRAGAFARVKSLRRYPSCTRVSLYYARLSVCQTLGPSESLNGANWCAWVCDVAFVPAAAGERASERANERHGRGRPLCFGPPAEARRRERERPASAPTTTSFPPSPQRHSSALLTTCPGSPLLLRASHLCFCSK